MSENNSLYVPNSLVEHPELPLDHSGRFTVRIQTHVFEESAGDKDWQRRKCKHCGFEHSDRVHTPPPQAPDPMSQVKENALKDPTYCPYCLRCSGLVRMRKVEHLLWTCKCGAIHDERQKGKT